MLRREGWLVNRKKVQRLWREGGQVNWTSCRVPFNATLRSGSARLAGGDKVGDTDSLVRTTECQCEGRSG